MVRSGKLFITVPPMSLTKVSLDREVGSVLIPMFMHASDKKSTLLFPQAKYLRPLQDAIAALRAPPREVISDEG